jgi:hypothetical protein
MFPAGSQDQHPSTILGTREHAEHLTKLRFPAVRDALQWLTFAHLPEALQNYSRPYYQTAVELVTTIKDCPELVQSLHALISSKDWAVRAGIRSDTGRAGSVSRPQTVVAPPLFGSAQVPARPDQALPGSDR